MSYQDPSEIHITNPDSCLKDDDSAMIEAYNETVQTVMRICECDDPTARAVIARVTRLIIDIENGTGCKTDQSIEAIRAACQWMVSDPVIKENTEPTS